jgi:hypothetical protein
MTCAVCQRTVYRATWRPALGMVCTECDHPALLAKVPGSMFPYVTTHLDPDGKPVVIQSLRHLRQLEREYGKHSWAFNMDEKHWGDVPRGRH